MKTQILSRRVSIPAPSTEVFQWHAWPGAFERLTPRWETVEVLERRGGIENGARVVLRMRLGPFRASGLLNIIIMKKTTNFETSR